MARTQVRASQLLDGSLQRVDVDTTTPGQALVTRLIAGSGIEFTSTGVDSGTGDVTIRATKTHYLHSQLVAASTWSIVHNLGKHPSVVTYDSTVEKRVVVGDVEYVDTNEVRIYFSVPFAGEAYLN